MPINPQTYPTSSHYQYSIQQHNNNDPITRQLLLPIIPSTLSHNNNFHLINSQRRRDSPKLVIIFIIITFLSISLFVTTATASSAPNPNPNPIPTPIPLQIPDVPINCAVSVPPFHNGLTTVGITCHPKPDYTKMFSGAYTAPPRPPPLDPKPTPYFKRADSIQWDMDDDFPSAWVFRVVQIDQYWYDSDFDSQRLPGHCTVLNLDESGMFALSWVTPGLDFAPAEDSMHFSINLVGSRNFHFPTPSTAELTLTLRPWDETLPLAVYKWRVPFIMVDGPFSDRTRLTPPADLRTTLLPIPHLLPPANVQTQSRTEPYMYHHTEHRNGRFYWTDPYLSQWDLVTGSAPIYQPYLQFHFVVPQPFIITPKFEPLAAVQNMDWFLGSSDLNQQMFPKKVDAWDEIDGMDGYAAYKPFCLLNSQVPILISELMYPEPGDLLSESSFTITIDVEKWIPELLDAPTPISLACYHFYISSSVPYNAHEIDRDVEMVSDDGKLNTNNKNIRKRKWANPPRTSKLSNSQQPQNNNLHAPKPHSFNPFKFNPPFVVKTTLQYIDIEEPQSDDPPTRDLRRPQQQPHISPPNSASTPPKTDPAQTIVNHFFAASTPAQFLFTQRLPTALQCAVLKSHQNVNYDDLDYEILARCFVQDAEITKSPRAIKVGISSARDFAPKLTTTTTSPSPSSHSGSFQGSLQSPSLSTTDSLGDFSTANATYIMSQGLYSITDWFYPINPLNERWYFPIYPPEDGVIPNCRTPLTSHEQNHETNQQLGPESQSILTRLGQSIKHFILSSTTASSTSTLGSTSIPQYSYGTNSEALSYVTALYKYYQEQSNVFQSLFFLPYELEAASFLDTVSLVPASPKYPPYYLKKGQALTLLRNWEPLLWSIFDITTAQHRNDPVPIFLYLNPRHQSQLPPFHTGDINIFKFPRRWDYALPVAPTHITLLKPDGDYPPPILKNRHNPVVTQQSLSFVLSGVDIYPGSQILFYFPGRDFVFQIDFDEWTKAEKSKKRLENASENQVTEWFQNSQQQWACQLIRPNLPPIPLPEMEIGGWYENYTWDLDQADLLSWEEFRIYSRTPDTLESTLVGARGTSGETPPSITSGHTTTLSRKQRYFNHLMESSNISGGRSCTEHATDNIPTNTDTIGKNLGKKKQASGVITTMTSQFIFDIIKLKVPKTVKSDFTSQKSITVNCARGLITFHPQKPLAYHLHLQSKAKSADPAVTTEEKKKTVTEEPVKTLIGVKVFPPPDEDPAKDLTAPTTKKVNKFDTFPTSISFVLPTTYSEYRNLVGVPLPPWWSQITFRIAIPAMMAFALILSLGFYCCSRHCWPKKALEPRYKVYSTDQSVYWLRILRREKRLADGANAHLRIGMDSFGAPNTSSSSGSYSQSQTSNLSFDDIDIEYQPHETDSDYWDRVLEMDYDGESDRGDESDDWKQVGDDNGQRVIIPLFDIFDHQPSRRKQRIRRLRQLERRYHQKLYLNAIGSVGGDQGGGVGIIDGQLHHHPRTSTSTPTPTPTPSPTLSPTNSHTNSDNDDTLVSAQLKQIAQTVGKAYKKVYANGLRHRGAKRDNLYGDDDNNGGDDGGHDDDLLIAGQLNLFSGDFDH